jgi:hypothetical protein
MDIREENGILKMGTPVLEWTPLDQLTCPKCSARHFHCFALQYCTGGVPPRDIEIRDAAGNVEARTEVLCGGIPHEHLHIHCRICHFNFLMETKEFADNKAPQALQRANLHPDTDLGAAILGNYPLDYRGKERG